MPRATNGPASRNRRRRVLFKTKGFRGNRSRLFRYAKDALFKAQTWAYRDRKTLSEMAIADPKLFEELVAQSKHALEAKAKKLAAAKASA